MSYSPAYGDTDADDIEPLLSNEDFDYVGDEEARPQKRYRMMNREPAKEHYCEICKKSFRYPSKIREHMRKHNGEKPFVCEVCGASFTQGHPLKVHMRKHVGERPFKCDYCEKSFISLNAAKAHEKVHLRRQCKEEPEQQAMHYAMHTGGDRRLKSVHITDEGMLVESEAEAVVERDEANLPHTEQPEVFIFECPVKYCGIQSALREEVEAHIAAAHADVWAREDEEEVEVEEEGEGAGPAVDVVGDDLYSSDAHFEEVDYPYYEFVRVATPSGVGAEREIAQEEDAPVLHHADEDEEKPMREERETVRQPQEKLEEQTQKEREDEAYSVIYYEEGEGAPLYDAPPPKYEVEIMTTGEDSVHGVEEEIVPNDEEEIDVIMGMRMRVHTQPPRRVRSSYQEEVQHMDEYDVEAAAIDEILPRSIHKRKRKTRNGTGVPCSSRNLDWIIDAVAAGMDVSMASPHNRKKPAILECHVCGAIIKYPSKIKAHMRTHTGEKPFKCDICGATFSQRTPLRMHIRRHLDQRPFACEIDGCPSRFISQSLLNAHQSSRHLHTKRFVCMKGCGRFFASARNQRVHEGRCPIGGGMRGGERAAAARSRGTRAARAAAAATAAHSFTQHYPSCKEYLYSAEDDPYSMDEEDTDYIEEQPYMDGEEEVVAEVDEEGLLEEEHPDDLPEDIPMEEMDDGVMVTMDPAFL